MKAKTKERVRQILKEHPESRDCDKTLILKYLWKHGNILFYADFERALMEIPSLETITRIRRLFQAQGKYVGTKRAERLARQEQVKKDLGYD